MTKRDDARLGSFVTAAAAVFLLLVVAADEFQLALLGASDGMFLAVAAAIAMAGIGPWLVWSRRGGRVLRLECANGALVGRNLRVAAREVHAISVAPAAHGSSVAIKHGKRVTFVEVERAEDATRIAESLRAGPAKTSDVVIVLPSSRSAAVVQVMLSVAAIVAAPLYYRAATHLLFWPVVPDEKALFGISGVVAAALSCIFLIARQMRPHQAIALGMRGAWETHAALHRDHVAQKRDDNNDAEPPGLGAEHIRASSLGRGSEDIGAWLARIDALPAQRHAYRGDALDKDVLWSALGDAGAPVDTRMAAARVLRRRYGEEEHALVRVVDDPDVRLRVEACLDEHDDAERRIERLGPLFRARRLL